MQGCGRSDCGTRADVVLTACAQIPGVPVMYLQSHRYTIERLPEATMGGAPRT